MKAAALGVIGPPTTFANLQSAGRTPKCVQILELHQQDIGEVTVITALDRIEWSDTMLAVVALLNKWIGAIGPGEFAFQLVVAGLTCIIPYKIAKGSNAARYVFAIITAIGFLLMLGGGLKIPKLELVLSVILIPVEVWVIWRLFASDVSYYFLGDQGHLEPRPWYSVDDRRDPD